MHPSVKLFRACTRTHTDVSMKRLDYFQKYSPFLSEMELVLAPLNKLVFNQLLLTFQKSLYYTSLVLKLQHKAQHLDSLPIELSGYYRGVFV